MHFVMPHLATAAFWVALWKIMIANVILSGDNAVVIAMAARNLTEKHRRAAIIFGGAGAIVLLIIFCGLLGVLLEVPYLKLVGGLLLLWIGIKLVGDEEEGGDVKAHEQLWPAIWSIAFANTVMSLDNAIAITAAANGDFFLMCMGLIISVPIIIAGAAVISGLLARFPWLALVGAGLIGWIAGEVISGEGRHEELQAGRHAGRGRAAWFGCRLARRSYSACGAGRLGGRRDARPGHRHDHRPHPAAPIQVVLIAASS